MGLAIVWLVVSWCCKGPLTDLLRSA